VIRFEAVSKTYAAGKGSSGHAALREASLEVGQGEVFGVIGASGAGKSTLIRLINGLEPPTGGKVIVDGDDVAALDVAGLRALRRRVGMIFQHFNLLSSKTVEQNVAFPLKLAGRETIKTPAGNFDTIRLERIDNPDKIGRFWLAAERDWMPVKIQTKSGNKPTAVLTLKR
jgi:D-methionine transport system ATP-binding protein